MKVAFYKATRPGLQGIYSRAVRWWTRSPYSHAEIIFNNGMAASSSFVDGGVRLKRIAFNPAHWDFVDVVGDEAIVREWFSEHAGDGYDILGNVGFVIGFIRDSSTKWSCAESIAAALGYSEPWRYSPAILHSALQTQHRLGGFFTTGNK